MLNDTNDTNVIIPNSVLQTHVSVFNFFSVAYPKNFEKKYDGQDSAGNEQPSRDYIYRRIPRDTIAVYIR